MMNNYDRTLELVRESQESAGAALKQYETYQDSAAAATARLTAAWEEFYSKVINSDMITNVINSLTKLVETMSKIGPIWTTIMTTISAHSINKIIKSNFLSKILNSFSQEIENSAGEKITLTISSVFKNGIKLGIKEAFNKIDSSDFSNYSDALAEAGQVGAKKGFSIIGSVGKILPELALITAAILAIVGIIKVISKLIDENNKKIEKTLLEESKIIKEKREEYENFKKEKRIIEDNYKIYNKYKDSIILTEEELKEENEAVEAIKEQYDDLIVVTNEYGRQIILNTDDLEAHNLKLKDDTKEYEKQLALAKLIAVQQTESSKQKYGEGNKTYMQDWTVEQLTNSGYSQEEAQILEAYGEMFRNKEKKSGTFTDFVGGFFNFGNKKYLKNDSLYNNIINDIIGTGKFNSIEQAFGFIKGGYEGLDKIIETIQEGNKEELQRLVTSSEDNLTKQGKAIEQIIKKYAQISLDAQEILEKQTKEFSKSTLISTLEDINDSNLQNSVFNLYNNLNSFNNNSLIEQLIGDETDPKKIRDKIEELGKEINDYINELSPKAQQSFHELSKKLLDPSLSPEDKAAAKAAFKDAAGSISDEMNDVLEQFVAGSTIDQKRRKNLNEKLGFTKENFLDQFNSRQVQIIDQLRTINTKGFDLTGFLESDVGTQLIKSLSTLENDVLKDPSIYGKAHQIMIDFFQNSLKLEPKEAYDQFYAMFGDIPDAAVEAAGDVFGNAKELILTDPTKALTKKQSEEYQKLEATLGESLDYYKLINEEGEEYLSIAGRIAIFEKTAEQYENAILGDISSKLIQQKELKDINGSITEENKDQYDLLQKQIDLDEEKLEILRETREYTAQTTAALNNIDYAKGYSKNIKAIKDAQKEMQRANGVLDQDTARTLMSMGNGYIKYLNEKMIGEDKYYTLTKENAELMIADQRKVYNDWIGEQKDKLQDHIDILTAELNYFQSVVDAEGDLSEIGTQKEFDDKVNTLDNKLEAAETELEGEVDLDKDKNEEILKGADKTSEDFYNYWHASYSALRAEWDQLAKAMKAGEPTIGEPPEYKKYKREQPSNTPTDLNSPTKPSEGPNNQNPTNQNQNQKNKAAAQQQIDRINKALERLRAARDELEILGPDFDDTASGAGKTADEMKKLTKVLEDCADALEKLDKLLKDVNNNLKDITVDYNPFLDLFEAWEYEWDYYYNIKRLIADIGKQGEFIDNIISADYTTADEKVQAYNAKIGNITAKMSANDAYLLALRTGMAQTGRELMEEYGEYYKIDPETGQVYQTDKNLTQINDTINNRRQEIFELQKLQNIKENDLALEEATLDALEEKKSAQESILSELESQIDSYKNLDDIVADTSELEAQRDAIKLDIEVSDKSIREQKDKIQAMEDNLQEIKIQIELDEQGLKKLEDYPEKMADKLAEYEEYWDKINEEVLEQQELLQELAEIQNYYIDTAISTEQELYNAIVENYQKEIDQKKKQYDYLKQLDNDYLASIKENINKERQAREDAKNQKSYQQNIQRLQLLQQDTSGAYRNEIAQLGQEIEGQRQDLYDDLVDKQVEALEKEIEKRHELYDKEVAALEERLAYMQENAILLWEMVNEIVAGGSEEMMALLENTTDFINSNERNREKQRKQWEQDIKFTYEGVVNNKIKNIGKEIEKGKEYIDSLKEIKTAIEKNIETYTNSTEILIENDENFQSVMNAFMTEWNTITSDMTGYHKDWKDNVNALKNALEADIKAIANMNNTGGSIKNLDDALRKTAQEMYNDFLAERTRYKNELTQLIQQIQQQISAAVGAAAGAIRSAAESAQYVPQNDNSSSTGNPGDTGNPGGITKETRYKATITEYQNYKDYVNERNGKLISTYQGYYTGEAARAAAAEAVQRLKKNNPGKYYIVSPAISYAFAKGGLVNFTGPAWLDGTSSNPERILSPRQTKLFESMVHSLEKSTNSNVNSSFGSSYNIGDINTTIQVQKLDNETDVNKLVKQVEEKIVKSIRNRVVVSV